MYMKSKFKKGDISLIIVVLISGIILSFLIPLSQKVTIEANISRENLMSQQAVQAAKVGLDDWKYNLKRDETTIVIFPPGGNQNWPNINTSTIPNPPTLDLSGEWIILDDTPGNRVLYRVEYIEAASPSLLSRIVATGRVERGNLTIDRTLEESFK